MNGLLQGGGGELSWLALALFAAVLLFAAASDLYAYKIPNAASLCLLAAFPVAVALAPGDVPLLGHLGIAALVFGVGFVLFVLGGIGGGDVKLLAATSLWLGPQAILAFLLAVGLAGGALGLAVLIARKLAGLPVLAACQRRLPKLLQGGQPVPYGVAIAAGALFVAARLPIVSGS